MDIYFCDLCGVRVTDVDLSGGHGIRRQFDVICATCLEVGHGKDWLAKHSQAHPAPAKAKAAAAPAKMAQMAAGAGPISSARDRVRTVEEEEGDNTPSVSPRIIASDDDPAEESAHSELSLDQDDEPEAPASAQARNVNLSAAANSFSALSASAPAIEEDGAATDDLQDEDASSTSDQAKADIDGAASPFSFKDESAAQAPAVGEESAGGEDPKKPTGRTRKMVSQKDETLPADGGMTAKSDTMPVAKSSGTAASRKSSNKLSKSRGGKSGRRPQSTNKTVMIVSLFTLSLMVIFTLVMLMGRNTGQKARKTEEVNISAEVRHNISDAKTNANLALKGKKVADMNAALQQIFSLQPNIEEFGRRAKQHGWTDEQTGQYLETVGWPSLQSLIRVLHDEIAKQNNHD